MRTGFYIDNSTFCFSLGLWQQLRSGRGRNSEGAREARRKIFHSLYVVELQRLVKAFLLQMVLLLLPAQDGEPRVLLPCTPKPPIRSTLRRDRAPPR